MLEITPISLYFLSSITFFSILLDAFYEKKVLLGVKYLLTQICLILISIALLLKFGIYLVLFVPIIVFLVVLFSCFKK